MSTTSTTPEIILFHYPFSPYAKRITWYLSLRKIPYSQSLQPPTLPRPILSKLGISYRRIPLLAIGASIYYDTRLILAVLERAFPPSAQHPGLSTSGTAGLEALLEKFTVDAGVFVRAAQALPSTLPLLKDQKFVKDREEFSGASWKVGDRERMYPEALVHLRCAFDVLEVLLADGKGWVAGTEELGLADIQAAWPFDWIRDQLPPTSFPKEAHPKTWAWLDRFRKTVKAAEKEAKTSVTTLDEKAVVEHILSAPFHDQKLDIDESDPLQLKEGEIVELWPIDSGFRHKDKGRLVKLTRDEVAIAIQTKDGGKELRVHAPRWGFRIVRAAAAKAQL